MLSSVIELAINTSYLIPVFSWQKSIFFVIVSPAPIIMFEIDTSNGMIRIRGGSGKMTLSGGFTIITYTIVQDNTERYEISFSVFGPLF